MTTKFKVVLEIPNMDYGYWNSSLKTWNNTLEEAIEEGKNTKNRRFHIVKKTIDEATFIVEEETVFEYKRPFTEED